MAQVDEPKVDAAQVDGNANEAHVDETWAHEAHVDEAQVHEADSDAAQAVRQEPIRHSPVLHRLSYAQARLDVHTGQAFQTDIWWVVMSSIVGRLVLGRQVAILARQSHAPLSVRNRHATR